MYKNIVVTTFIVATMAATSVQAFQFDKPISSSVDVSKQSGLPAGKKQVYLTSIKLSSAEQESLFNYQPKKRAALSSVSLPTKIDLGMNNVPVLDQGPHATGVTFAVTAAIDAVLDEGDHVSQLCSLELGKYLEDNSSYRSDWNGSFGIWVLDQLLRFGIISKEDQKTLSCAGVTEYPLLEPKNEGNPMSLKEYKSKMSGVWGALYPISHMTFFQRFITDFNDTNRAEDVLTLVKKGLAKGNRSIMGSYIIVSPYCSAGACANHHTKHDTWALTEELKIPPTDTAIHEMVIIGYDDNAVAFDSQGKKHQGLLTLRNSWGKEVGDNGNFYMTYDYFKKFVGEVQEIQSMRD